LDPISCNKKGLICNEIINKKLITDNINYFINNIRWY